jgi:hypothetical protein
MSAPSLDAKLTKTCRWLPALFVCGGVIATR